ncbi:(2Fe-2S)-binding protein [Deinococcus sp. KSM4-11]|uniref:(2Fe-2S)-binding protein n=1 Tax=Deinococcus sp. KSM4-11 TaxID=2568654 RepID=UPI0010A3A9D0|nr:(2Fe-2S)-binding protein [Deinococcus sp. KSM4-11]THF88758.1 (2Fe-2S)-binding protein [Deinococcus sp. KSM4-11]
MPELWIEGRAVRVPDGSSVLAALQNAGIRTLRQSLSGEPRGALCGMGSCLECRALVDGRVVRTCLTPVRDGQHITLFAEGVHDR